jgi:hypothetical protein
VSNDSPEKILVRLKRASDALDAAQRVSHTTAREASDARVKRKAAYKRAAKKRG